MPCFSPIKGYRAKHVNASGKRSIVFSKNDGFSDLPVEINCGQCVGCRLEKSRQWAIRCLHEASLYDENCFITLTYNDEKLPSDNSLNKGHFQLFMKRLREKFKGRKIRYYHCGEYGDKTDRPHYHAIIFNLDFQDKELYSSREGVQLYTSETLEKVWQNGFATIGDVTFESAAYVARYVMKKVTGERAEEHYKSLNPYTGEIIEIEPEYTTMSRRPGIGQPWLEKYETDVYPEDFVVVNGKKMKPPKYYDNLMERKSVKEFETIKNKRKKRASKHKEDQTPERLAVREKVAKARIQINNRGL